MKVKELIEKLKICDMDADVAHLWDGELRTNIEFAYMGKTGICVTADYEQVAYSEDARPVGAPDKKAVPYWETAECPKSDCFEEYLD